MSITRISVDLEDPTTFLEGRVDLAVVDGTTEAEIAAQQKEDEIEAMRDAARYVRRVRRRLGLSQVEMARRALLRVLDKAPETALRVLT